jgi:clan AA aspartic protease (TIGR02281 family)
VTFRFIFVIVLIGAFQGCATRENLSVREEIVNTSANHEKTQDEITYKSPLDLLRSQAERGDINAQNLLGVHFERGDGVVKDYYYAFQWYEKAAIGGSPIAQNNLAELYYLGKGVQINYKKAMEWYAKSADQNYAPAMVAIGYWWLNGGRGESDYKIALDWFNKAKHTGPGANADLAILRAETMIADIHNKAPESKQVGIRVPIRRNGGVFEVKVKINSEISMYFVVDSGASNVVLPERIAKILIDNNSLSGGDFIREAKYTIANGDIHSGKVVKLKSMEIGGYTVNDVEAAIIPGENTPPLLGLSALGKFKDWKIDRDTSNLIIIP